VLIPEIFGDGMKRITFPSLLLLTLILTCSSAFCDEGMWLYSSFPANKVKETFGFEPSQAWLDHVRLSSVRFNNGGSGSFVSGDGLVFTNHHVGAKCVQELSKSGKDYMKLGFYAKTRAEEAKCPNLELNVLQSTEDVTAKVNAAVQPSMATAEKGKAQHAAMAAIEKDCSATTGLRCDVVTLYSGSIYHLYRYKKYTDVRLVFAPEFQMAFFGGDDDNFTYPRYDLDITFFRVYEKNKPAEIKDYLRWSKAGVSDGDLIFVSGHPGSTGRWLTDAQKAFLRDTEYPFRIESYRKRIAELKTFSGKSAENARVAREAIFGLENSLKAITGYNEGLLNKEHMDAQTREEEKVRALVSGNAKLKADVGDPWAAIETAMQEQSKIFMPYIYVEKRGNLRNDLGSFARDLVRLAAERPKPNAERLREYRDTAMASVEQDLFSTAPVYPALEVQILTSYFENAEKYLTGDYAPLAKKMLAGKTPEQRAKELVSGTKLADVADRRKLYEGQVAIDASKDPMILFAREMDADARTFRKLMDDKVDAVERSEGAKIARLKFDQGGFEVPPDATFTLRLSYGSVVGYEEGGKDVAPFTTMGEAFTYSAATKQKPANVLPVSWNGAEKKLNPKTPLNFVSTADIIGGNSGSPVVNKHAEVVGIIFDGNIQSLPWRFYFDSTQGRAVSVDARGIQEALRSIYSATPLADELIVGHTVSEVPMNVGK
jgi:hypothetical protein